MIVDTSAIVALVLGEPEAELIEDALARSVDVRISAPGYVELAAVLNRSRRPEIARTIDRVLASYGIRIESFGSEHAKTAAQAYRDYGKGSGHAAQLNLGDTFSYAAASMADEPLLFVGEDFTHTDLRRVLE